MAEPLTTRERAYYDHLRSAGRVFWWWTTYEWTLVDANGDHHKLDQLLCAKLFRKGALLRNERDGYGRWYIYAEDVNETD